jgi:membrane protease YdiL (CAAX protease family)
MRHSGAILVSALLFGLSHLGIVALRGAPPDLIARTAAWGLAFGLAYAVTGRLWVPIALHAANNIIVRATRS